MQMGEAVCDRRKKKGTDLRVSYAYESKGVFW